MLHDGFSSPGVMAIALPSLFDRGPFLPHGYCYLWTPGLVELHLISDVLIAIAYFSIPLTLLYFIRKRHDVPYRWMFALFGLFIVGCGATHVMEAWTLWYPTYWLSGGVKALTAVASLGTALLLVRVMPEALTLPSPAQFEAMNRDLARQILERQQAEETVRKLNAELEQRVHERTAQLQATNTALAQEVVERQQAEEALRRSEERYRSLTIASAQIVWTANSQGQTIEVNPTWKAFTGQSDQEAAGWGWFNAIHPDDRQTTGATWTQAVANHSIYTTEYRIRRFDGVYRFFAVRGAPVFEKDGAVREWIGACIDITERKQAEEALHALNVELEQRVAARTAELTALNRELEAFSYSVSHDLRAPLRNVSGFADLLQKSAGSRLDAQAQRYLSIITDETKRMGILIDELLAFSRLGRAEPRKTPVDLNQLIQEVRDNLQLETQGREIRWRVGVLPQVCADRALLRQVIVNLIANAIKFTRTRPVAEIEVGALSLTTNDTEDVFFIRDNGVGFNMQYKGKLFGVFQRLHGTSEFEGTGIGLASVQRIVNRHGGRVWAEAAVDQGATFFVSLPKETAKETARMEIWI
jgi:hypothetical protein